MKTTVSPLLLLVAVLSGLLGACSPPPPPPPPPPPTPSPTADTLVAAARAYSAFVTSWTGRYADGLNVEAAAADADATKLARYSSDLADAYQAFADGVGKIEFPEAVRPSAELELQTVATVIALARQLANEPTNVSVKGELQGALARVAQSSASLEAALRLSN